MKEKAFFEYLEGNWMIAREIIAIYSPFNKINGKVSFLKSEKNKLNYKESVTIHSKDGLIMNGYKEYEYQLKNNTIISVYNKNTTQDSFMFNLILSQNQAKGVYNCEKDTYDATYNIIDDNKFNVVFKVNGPEKDYSIITNFVRDDIDIIGGEGN